MRSKFPATLVALGILAIHAYGCAGNEVSPTPSGGATQGAGGGTGGAGGAGGSGGEGGQACTPKTEACDGLDNDCDGEVDEGCACQQGQTQACYSGPAGTEGTGPCGAGQQTCDAQGAWGPCIGETIPKKQESCNGVDDDCNGAVDDMGVAVCGVGACQVMVTTCDKGKLNVCEPLPPSLEICDGLDNDCDKQVDESFPGKGVKCATGLAGACAQGVNNCVGGKATCVPDIMPVPETCNDIDDDCDGVVDNDIPGTGGECGSGYPGVCTQGKISCKGGLIDCFPAVEPSPEVCNGLDDDCDGTTDEGNPGGGATCDSGKPGICGAGTQACVSGAIACVPNKMPGAETCNGLDDDCDGMTDEGNPGGGAACGCGGAFACTGGKLKCSGGSTIFFYDDFTNPDPGWTLGQEWAIGPANLNALCGDPKTDATATQDNMLAGVIIGDCSTSSVNKTLHDYYYLTSPVFNTASAPAVYLQFQRWLTSDSTSWMKNTIDVFNGTSWVNVWTSSGTVTDTTWTKMTYDLSAYKNANMQIRFGFNILLSSVSSKGGWNVDDVYVGATSCP